MILRRSATLAALFILLITIFTSCTAGGPLSGDAAGNPATDGDEELPLAVAALAKGAIDAELYEVNVNYPFDPVETFNQIRYATIVDRNGGVVMRGEGIGIIYNSDGTSAIGIVQRRYEESGMAYSALYDVKGELLRDFALCYYEGDRGDLMRMYDVATPSTVPRYMLINANDGKPVNGEYLEGYPGDEEIPEYYDVEGYQYRDESVGIRWSDDDETRELTDKGGRVLFSGAEELMPLKTESNGRALTFMAVKNGKIYALSRNGEILAERKADDADMATRSGGFIFADGKAFDSDLNVIVDGKYEGGYAVPDFPVIYDDENWHYMDGMAARFIVMNGGSYDIFDAGGNLLWGDVRPTDDQFRFGPDRIVLQRGFKRGLVDAQGGWLYEESIFNELQD